MKPLTKLLSQLFLIGLPWSFSGRDVDSSSMVKTNTRTVASYALFKDSDGFLFHLLGKIMSDL